MYRSLCNGHISCAEVPVVRSNGLLDRYQSATVFCIYDRHNRSPCRGYTEPDDDSFHQTADDPSFSRTPLSPGKQLAETGRRDCCPRWNSAALRTSHVGTHELTRIFRSCLSIFQNPNHCLWIVGTHPTYARISETFSLMSNRLLHPPGV